MQEKFGVKSIRGSRDEMMAALYLQVSIVSQALIFVTRSRSWSFIERPGMLLMTAFMIAQLVSILLITETPSSSPSQNAAFSPPNQQKKIVVKTAETFQFPRKQK